MEEKPCMEKVDQELLQELAPSHPELKRLYEEHIRLEREVERLERYSKYSSSAELRHKTLKKRKLMGMDAIMSILSQHRHGGIVNGGIISSVVNGMSSAAN